MIRQINTLSYGTISMKGCNNMNKEQIKKFWDDHKEEIIGGTLVLVSCVIIGVSVGSAVKASKQKLQMAAQAEIGYKDFIKEVTDLGAVMKPGNPYPIATKEVAEKVLNKGEVYLLDGVHTGIKMIYVFDAKTLENTGFDKLV